jgi:hypothetical protein
MVRTTAIAAFAAASIGIPAAQAADSVTPLAMRALDRGYGKVCSLEMTPVSVGGYYPCLDFGPYRIVKQYGRVTGYVIRDGKQPFLVFRLEDGIGGFTVKGPWETDMPARITIFWNDVVEGRGQDSKDSQDLENERQAAEAYVSGLSKKAPATAPAASPASRETASPGGGGIIDALSGTTATR